MGGKGHPQRCDIKPPATEVRGASPAERLWGPVPNARLRIASLEGEGVELLMLPLPGVGVACRAFPGWTEWPLCCGKGPQALR